VTGRPLKPRGAGRKKQASKQLAQRKKSVFLASLDAAVAFSPLAVEKIRRGEVPDAQFYLPALMKNRELTRIVLRELSRCGDKRVFIYDVISRAVAQNNETIFLKAEDKND